MQRKRSDKNDIFRETSDHDANCKGPSRKKKNIIELRDDDNYDLDKAEGKIDTDEDNGAESMIGGAKEESSTDTNEDTENTMEEDTDNEEEDEDDEEEEDAESQEDEEEEEETEEEETEEEEEEEEEEETENEPKTIRIQKTYIWSNYAII